MLTMSRRSLLASAGLAAAFGLGKGNTTIPMVDAHGVLVVAIQALHRQVGELRAEIDQLHQQLTAQSPRH